MRQVMLLSAKITVLGKTPCCQNNALQCIYQWKERGQLPVSNSFKQGQVVKHLKFLRLDSSVICHRPGLHLVRHIYLIDIIIIIIIITIIIIIIVVIIMVIIIIILTNEFPLN